MDVGLFTSRVIGHCCRAHCPKNRHLSENHDFIRITISIKNFWTNKRVLEIQSLPFPSIQILLQSSLSEYPSPHKSIQLIKLNFSPTAVRKLSHKRVCFSHFDAKRTKTSASKERAISKCSSKYLKHHSLKTINQHWVFYPELRSLEFFIAPEDTQEQDPKSCQAH